MLKTLVKIDTVSQLQNARYAAGMGVEFVGFSLDPNAAQFIDSATLTELTQWLSGVKIVGELADSQVVIPQDCKLDYLQTSNKNSVKELKKQNIPLILEIKNLTDLETVLSKNKADVSYFLISLSNTNTSKELDLLKGLAKKYPLLIKGVNQRNVEEVLAQVQPKGITLQDDKNIDVLADVLELIELDD
jgi:phosphoribosylanthranilate isomerase